MKLNRLIKKKIRFGSMLNKHGFMGMSMLNKHGFMGIRLLIIYPCNPLKQLAEALATIFYYQKIGSVIKIGLLGCRATILLEIKPKQPKNSQKDLN